MLLLHLESPKWDTKLGVEVDQPCDPESFSPARIRPPVSPPYFEGLRCYRAVFVYVDILHGGLGPMEQRSKNVPLRLSKPRAELIRSCQFY